MIGLTILGSTGSIGENTLNVAAQHPQQFNIIALAANRNVEKLYQQCLQYQPKYAVLNDSNSAEQLAKKLQATNIKVLAGQQGLAEIVTVAETDYVMAAIVGAAGLPSTLAAVQAGKRVLLANKEALVMAGELMMSAAKQSGADILPIDSEHNALFQCMPQGYKAGYQPDGVKKVLLTVSGGPVWRLSTQELNKVTPQQAGKHPNWNMGPKITIDSATLMNKGLEVIEAKWLFDLAPEQIDVILHPQSIIHSMVEYEDGSVLAQMGMPDMRIPIAYGLAWPLRISSGVEKLDLIKAGKLEFYPPPIDKFPCLSLAYQALQHGLSAPAVLNAANEIAVQAFIDNKILFTDIAKVIAHTLENSHFTPINDLQTALQVDQSARMQAIEGMELIKPRNNKELSSPRAL